MKQEDLIHRIKTAVTLLNDNQTINVGELTFSLSDKTQLIVTGWSTKINLTAITKQSALMELEEVKKLFLKMVEASTELSEFIKGKQIEYNLNFDSYKSGIEICKEKNGKLNWMLNF